MSKHTIAKNIQFAACAASYSSNQVAVTGSQRNRSCLLTLTAVLCSLAVPALAQNPAVSRIAPEQGFTITPNAITPMVFKTEPGAACDLHPADENNAVHRMRLYANAEGYIRAHVNVKQASGQDMMVLLDCTTSAAATTYPIRLRAGSEPTVDMPAPEGSMPTPKGAIVLPAMTEDAARYLADSDVIALGYPPRPDATASPDRYAKWLDMVARPITLVPPDSGSRSDRSHLPSVEAGTSAQAGLATSANWSGYELTGPAHTYEAVQAEWNVPATPIGLGEPGHSTSSAFWVGLDGASSTDVPLLQAGTEQDVVDAGGVSFNNYYSWTELVPVQPTEVPTGVAVSPGDQVFVHVYIMNSSGTAVDPYGNSFHAWIVNNTTHIGTHVTTALPKSLPFKGTHAEWIMERPCLASCGTTPVFADLANYSIAFMTSAFAETGPYTWIPAGATGSTQMFMYESLNPHPDNNVLSVAAAIVSGSSSLVQFNFANWH